MKRLIPFILVFLLVFLCGTGFLMLKRVAQKPEPPRPQPRRTEAVKGILPALKLPDEKKNEVGTDGWEFEGETASNFISTRAKITAALLHDGWSPENQITLDDKLSPRVLLTFRKAELELTLMLWKIDTGTTGFAYRREKIVKPGVELE
ncbi:MAG: hypothetical protein PUC15_09855 [Lentisphaeria bacterium]|nr:hypothetical protein [Lentisphaeria bacterium]